MNSFTLEASFHGYLNKDRQTIEFFESHFKKLGSIVGQSLYEYVLILKRHEEEKKKQKRAEEKKKKLKKLKNA